MSLNATTVKQYLIDYFSASSLAKKMQFADMCMSTEQEPKLLKPLYDMSLEGVLLHDDNTIKPLYRWSDSIVGQNEDQIEMLKSLDKVAFYVPLIPSLDTITQQVWAWQQQFDGRASVPGVLNHLKNEIAEFEETEQGSEEQEKEFADLYILLMHLAALSNIDVRTAVSNKLAMVQKRDYSGEPDAEGCITHKK
jgi:hypothetical protein